MSDKITISSGRTTEEPAQGWTLDTGFSSVLYRQGSVVTSYGLQTGLEEYVQFRIRQAAPKAQMGGSEQTQVGWAYNDKQWDQDRWHVCGMDSRPRSSDGRRVEPIFVGVSSSNRNPTEAITPQMLRDTAAWCQSEDELRSTLRRAANALEAANG